MVLYDSEEKVRLIRVIKEKFGDAEIVDPSKFVEFSHGNNEFLLYVN